MKTINVNKPALLVSLIISICNSLTAKINLPESSFPLGHPELTEIRTTNELRPGLTHVHVVRGDLNEKLPKLSLESEKKSDPKLLAPLKGYLKGSGYTVQDHQSDSEHTYWLSTEEFDTFEEARHVAMHAPSPMNIINPAATEAWKNGPYSLNIVIIDPKKYHGKIVAAWSGKSWRSSPLELSRRDNAIVAINGSWFSYSRDNIPGVPSGISIVQGEWHHEHYSEEKPAAIIFIENHVGSGPALTIDYKGPPLPEFKWSDGKSIRLDGIDRMPKDNELVAMRIGVWKTSQLSHGYPDHVLPMQISKDGYLSTDNYYFGGDGLIVMATGEKQAILKEALESKKPVELDLKIAGCPGLNAFYSGHVFVRNGQIAPQKPRLDRIPYTTVGSDSEGNIYLISTDGPPFLFVKNGPIGINTDELLKVVQFLGLTNAANLDGGANSTSMVIDGKVLGQFADYYLSTKYDDGRKVADSVLIIDDE